ncbi:MAG: DUF2752 domain-containing protein [Saprospiraceae bacterium]|nr:DUF2752 domain-containing protein [Saprospiraceae bacterium]
MQKETAWLKVKNLFPQIKAIGVLIAPVAFYFVPLDWVNSHPSICLYKNLFHKECYGCGITRAVISAIHLDFYNAFSYNKSIILVFPLLFLIWLKFFLLIFFNKKLF